MSKVEQVAGYLKEHEKDAVARLIDWLRIPSVSTDPKYRADVRKAAEWARGNSRRRASRWRFAKRGTRRKRGAGHPIVWAESRGGTGLQGAACAVLRALRCPAARAAGVVGEPAIRAGGETCCEGGPDERIVARGAVDDKGQVASFLEALLAWKHVNGSVPIRMTVLLEGEEESGSVNLERFVQEHDKELRACDVCVISDTGMLGRGKPAITYGVRGLAYTEVTLHGPNQGLHSGSWGGRMPNPLNELTKVLAQLWDADRRVTIPGFYDAVLEPTQSERDAWAKLGFDQIAALKAIGMPPAADVGEKGWSGLEREWARPTAEINGMFGGYTGKGAKTVIPTHATAKVSFRLVAKQNPHTITKAFFKWCEDRTPPGSRWEFIDHSGGFPGNVAQDSAALQAARKAAQGQLGRGPGDDQNGWIDPGCGHAQGQTRAGHDSRRLRPRR